MNTINSLRQFAREIKANWIEIDNENKFRIFDTIASAYVEVGLLINENTHEITIEIGHSKENSRDDYVDSIDKMIEKVNEYPVDYQLDDYPINSEEIQNEIEVLLYTLLDGINAILEEIE